jgi:hypothetical protein
LKENGKEVDEIEVDEVHYKTEEDKPINSSAKWV